MDSKKEEQVGDAQVAYPAGPPPYSVITIQPHHNFHVAPHVAQAPIKRSAGDIVGPPILAKPHKAGFVRGRWLKWCSVAVVFVLKCFALYQLLNWMSCWRTLESKSYRKLYDATVDLLLAAAGYFCSKVLWTDRDRVAKLLSRQGMAIPLDASDEPSKRMIRRMMGRTGPRTTFYILITSHCVLGVAVNFLLRLSEWRLTRARTLGAFLDSLSKSLFLDVLAVAQVYMVVPVFILTVSKLDRIQTYIIEDMRDLRQDITFISLRNVHRRWMSCARFIEDVQRLYRQVLWACLAYFIFRYSHMTCSFIWALFVSHKLDSNYYSFSLSLLQLCYDMSIFGLIVFYAGKAGQHLPRPLPILDMWFLRKPTFGNLKFHIELLRLRQRVSKYSHCMFPQVNLTCGVLVKAYGMFALFVVLYKYGPFLLELTKVAKPN